MNIRHAVKRVARVFYSGLVEYGEAVSGQPDTVVWAEWSKHQHTETHNVKHA